MTNAITDMRPGYRKTLFAWLFLLAFETTSQLALKIGGEALAHLPFGLAWLMEAARNPWVIVGVFGYLGAFSAWMVILDRIPLSFGFPLTAMVMLVVAIASHYVFGEELTAWRMAGIGLIVAGVVVMGGGDG
ncbi:EamA family transporter [Labrys sp. LIt4]|uniref:EamA family transporter n=1 Tax=Labrys sp. LIt4 TaxID=2821355 RepID=UPI001ADF4538|nr:EamA family transporter [Labrys sp. LIt4]MBP0580248.1 EamA family transporter [Labrys sp. LIt4]